MEKDKKSERFNWARWAYRGIFLLVLALIVFAAFVAVKIWFIYSIYTWFIDWFTSTLGLDFQIARIFSVLGTTLLLLALPWILSFLVLGRHKVKVVLVGTMALVLVFIAVDYGAKEVFFDRNSGKAIRSYIKTCQGYKTSSREDYDPKYGVKYQWFNPEIIKEYELWQETGKMAVPEIMAGQYFDQLTGNPKVWYVERPNGELWLSPLPGYDPATKILLKPFTEEYAKNNAEKIKKAIAAGQTLETDSKIVKNRNQSSESAKASEKAKTVAEAIENGTLPIEWYLDEPGIEVESEKIRLGHGAGFFGGGDWVHDYNVYVEKVVFIHNPPCIIVGVCFEAVRSTIIDVSAGYIIDSRGIKHETLRYIGAKKEFGIEGYKIHINTGEIKRVLYVINSLPLNRIKKGVFSYHDSLIVFSKKES